VLDELLRIIAAARETGTLDDDARRRFAFLRAAGARARMGAS
jgi:hypothetical protein